MVSRNCAPPACIFTHRGLWIWLYAWCCHQANKTSLLLVVASNSLFVLRCLDGPIAVRKGQFVHLNTRLSDTIRPSAHNYRTLRRTVYRPTKNYANLPASHNAASIKQDVNTCTQLEFVSAVRYIGAYVCQRKGLFLLGKGSVII